MKKLIVPFMVPIIICIIVGYVSAGSGPGMPNPADVYCSEMGYELKNITGKDGGQHSICILPDGSSCDAWRFFEGKCGKEYSYCARQGHGLKVKSDGKNSFSSDYAVCVDKSGKEVGSMTDLLDLKKRYHRPIEGLPKLEPSPPKENLLAPTAIPSSFDWRNYNGFDWMTPVKNQSQCGACWAFSAVGTVEATYNIYHNAPNLDIDLSEEYVNTDCNGNGQTGCCGGWHDQALKAIRDNGVPDDACMVFDVANFYRFGTCSCSPSPCAASCPNGGGTSTDCSHLFCDDACFDAAGRLVKIKEYYNAGANDRDKMKQNLVEKGPLSVALDFGGTRDANGIYRCDCSSGCSFTHAVVIVGYDDTQGYWIIKNSWGDTEGPHGNGYREIGYSECRIEELPYYVEAADKGFPIITVPGDITFSGTCVVDSSSMVLNVCNTGRANLQVYSITSSNAQFTVTEPSSGYPAIISPDFCYPFPVRFAPTSKGQKTATLTIQSNDIGHPSIVIDAQGEGIQQNIATFISDNGNFGNICPGSFKDMDLTISNNGGCNLSISNISSNSAEFIIPAGIAFPLVISPGGSAKIPVRFQPTSNGAKSGNITITSNAPSSPTTVAVSGNAPSSAITRAIANAGNFGDVCLGSLKDMDLTINNSGGCNLSVSNITSNSNEFIAPGVTFPLIVSAGSSTRVPIRFQPTSLGPKSATVTITSNAPTSPTTVDVSGNVPPGDVRVTGSFDFGDVCAGTLAEKTISVCNVGKCNLAVTRVAFDPACSDFSIINNPFPATVSPDSCVNLVIRFTPTSDGPKSCTLVITSDDPDASEITKTVTADTPEPSIDIPSNLTFLPTVIQSLGNCQSQKSFPISNTGTCNLTITDVSITNNSAEYSLVGRPSLPIILEPGHIAGEGDLMTVFQPMVLDRERTGQLTVTYETDPTTHATTSVTRDFCGEGTMTGARVLVTQNGTPLLSVEQIKIQRINGNRNRKIVDTIDVSKNLDLQTVTQDPPCATFQFHREYGTVSNPIQLLPGDYTITATAIINGKRKSKTVGFNVDTCGFNQNIEIRF